MESNKNLNVPNKGRVPKLRFPEFSGEWEEKYLSDLMTFKNGLNASKDDYGSGYKFINVLDIINSDFIKHDSIIGSVNVKEADFQKNIVEYGDILFQRSSETREEVGQANVYLDKKNPSTFGGFVIRGKKKTDYNPIFLNYLLKTVSARKEITSKSGGSTRYNVGQETLSSVKIYMPSLLEQSKIASILSNIEDRISTQSKIIEDYKLLKKGMMQRIFNQELRFKDEHNNFYPEWKEKRLEEVCNLIKDGSHGTHKDDNSSFCFLLSAKNIIGNKVTFDSTDRKIPQKDYDSIYKNYQLLQGDILLTIVGTIGRVAIWKDTYPQIAFQRSVAILRFKKELPTFIAQLFNSDSFQKELLRKQVVSAQPGLYLGDIAKLLIKLPSIPEQQKIALALLSIDKKIELETEFLKRLKSQKQHFLQNLFI